MSELIDNRKHRQETLKSIIKDLHAGVSTQEIKERFAELLDQVGASEIGEIEQSLINEGLPVEEIQELCNIHVEVFKEGLEKQKAAEAIQGEEDPLEELRKENKRFSEIVAELQDLVKEIGESEAGSNIANQIDRWSALHAALMDVDAHYSKKENILFPYLEKYGITGPPTVMWGIHDEIRAELKATTKIIANIQENLASPQLAAEIGGVVLPVLNEVSEMIYKEENILFPMCRDTFTVDEWNEIKAQFTDPLASVYQSKDEKHLELPAGTGINLDIGVLSAEQINLILKHLPIDMTFVDENDEVRYFSAGPERIFDRTRAIIGRKVQFCHPPNSMGIVEQILDDFRSGKRDSADFWINMRGQTIYIRYFAVRDENGNYKGTLEVSQNITDIKAITGEKRIYDYS